MRGYPGLLRRVLNPNLQQATDFLRWLAPSGPWSIGAIGPDDGALAWLTTSDAAQVEAFVVEHQAKCRNVYFQPNLCRPDLGDRRASKDSVVVGLVVHADVDPPHVSTGAELAAWQEKFAAGISDPARWSALELPPPTVVIFSGSGFQMLWRLDAPVVLWRRNDDLGHPAQDPRAVAEIENRNYAVLRRLDPDHPGTHNVDRLLRLPGTLNYPNKIKREKHGRSEPVLSFAVPLGASCALDALAAETAPVTKESKAPVVAQGSRVTRERLSTLVPEWLLEDIVDGPGPDGDRSRAGFSATCSLIKSGVDDETIAAILGDPEFKISGHYLDQGNTKRAINRAIDAAHDEVDPELTDIREVCAALATWVDRAPAAPAVLPPTEGRAKSWLEAAETKLKRSTVPAKRHDGNLLARVRKADIIVDIRELAEAAIAVAKHAPEGTTSDQLRGILTPCASGDSITRLGELAQAAIERVASERAHDGVDASDFENDQKTNRPVSTSQKNVRLALRLLGIEFKYNTFADHELMVRDGISEIIEDHHIKTLRAEMEQRFEFRPDKDNLFDLCEVIGRESAFHPVRDWIDSLPVDAPLEDDLTSTWLIRFGGAEDTPFVRAISRIVLVAAIRRIRQPGCKFDEMLILETPEQGKGKSSALRALVPDGEWFTDDFKLDATDSRRMMEMTDGKWIVEAGELKGMGNAGVSDMKQYLSRQIDTSRMAYARKARRAPRQFVLIATTNEGQYLKDNSGNRRYWPILLREFDVAALRAVRDQLWAEAARLDTENPEPEYIRLDPALYEAAAAQQESRRMQDPFEVILAPVLEGMEGILDQQDVWKLCGFTDQRRPNHGESHRINEVMLARLKWARAQRRRGSMGRRSCYVSSADVIDGAWLELRFVGAEYQLVAPKIALPPN